MNRNKKYFSFFFLFAFIVMFGENAYINTASGYTFSADEVAVTKSSLYIYDADNVLIDSKTGDFEGNWIRTGYPSIEYAFSNPFLCDPLGNKVTAQYYINNTKVVTTSMIGDQQVIYRQYYYGIDLMARTKVYFDVISSMPQETITMPGIDPALISTYDEDFNGWDVDGNLHSMIVIEEQAPADRWWSYSLDNKYGTPPSLLNPSGSTNGKQYQLPLSGLGSGTQDAPYGDYVYLWRDADKKQAETFSTSSFDYDAILDHYGGKQIIIEPRINVKLQPFLDGDYTVTINGEKETFTFQDKYMGIYSAEYAKQPIYGYVQNLYDTTTVEQQWSDEMRRLFGTDTPQSEQTLTGNTKNAISAYTATGMNIAVPITFGVPETKTDTFMINAPSKGTPLAMFEGSELKSNVQFSSSLALAMNSPSEVELRPKLFIQPEFLRTEMKISAEPRYYGYYNPGKDINGQDYYTGSTKDIKLSTQEITMTNRVTVKNTFVGTRIMVKIISASTFDSTYVPYADGNEIGNFTDFGNNVGILDLDTDLDDYVPPTSPSSPVDVTTLTIITIVSIVGVISAIFVIQRRKKVSRTKTPIVNI